MIVRLCVCCKLRVTSPVDLFLFQTLTFFRNSSSKLRHIDSFATFRIVCGKVFIFSLHLIKRLPQPQDNICTWSSCIINLIASLKYVSDIHIFVFELCGSGPSCITSIQSFRAAVENRANLPFKGLLFTVSFSSRLPHCHHQNHLLLTLLDAIWHLFTGSDLWGCLHPVLNVFIHHVEGRTWRERLHGQIK